VDTSGTVLERVVYDPYGNPTFYDGSWTTPAATSSYENVVLYCGYHLDPETGLYLVRRRVYHPTLGRWVQRDPAGYVDGPNMAEYVGNAPTRGLDPSGKWGTHACTESKIREALSQHIQSGPFTDTFISSVEVAAPDQKCGECRDLGKWCVGRVSYRRVFRLWQAMGHTSLPTSGWHQSTTYVCKVRVGFQCECSRIVTPFGHLRFNYHWGNARVQVDQAIELPAFHRKTDPDFELPEYWDSAEDRVKQFDKSVRGGIPPGPLSGPSVLLDPYGAAASLVGSSVIERDRALNGDIIDSTFLAGPIETTPGKPRRIESQREKAEVCLGY